MPGSAAQACTQELAESPPHAPRTHDSPPHPPPHTQLSPPPTPLPLHTCSPLHMYSPRMAGELRSQVEDVEPEQAVLLPPRLPKDRPHCAHGLPQARIAHVPPAGSPTQDPTPSPHPRLASPSPCFTLTTRIACPPSERLCERSRGGCEVPEVALTFLGWLCERSMPALGAGRDYLFHHEQVLLG